MSAAHIIDKILQDTSDKKIEWLPFNKFDKEQVGTLTFTHAQHFVPAETVFCIYEGEYFFLVTYQLMDFVSKSIVSQFTLVTLRGTEQNEFSADQRKLNELKSLIFLNSLS